MAYNKSKGKQKHGDVIYDEDTDTQIDFEQNEIKFRTGGTIRGSFTNSGLSVTGSYITSGALSASLGITGSSFKCDEEVSAATVHASVSVSSSLGVTGSGFNTDGTVWATNVHTNIYTSSAGNTKFYTNASPGFAFYGRDSKIKFYTSDNLVTSSVDLRAAAFSIMPTSSLTFYAGENGLVSSSNNLFVGGESYFGNSGLTISSAGLLSSSATPTLVGLNVGQGMFTVANNGLVSASATPTLTGLDIGEGTFTVGKEGAIKSSGSLNVSGHTSLGITGSLVPLHVNGSTQQILITSQLNSVVAGTSIAQINFGSSVLSSNFYTGAKIEALGDCTWDLANNSSPTRLTLSTVPSGSATARSRLTINSSGTVGIGDNFYPTTNALLHVSASTQEYNLYVAGGKVGINTATLSSSAELTVSGTVSATTMSASSNVNVGGTLNAANSGFMVDADGDTTVKSLTAAAGDVKGIVISGSSVATLFGLDVGQGALTVTNQGLLSSSATPTLVGLNVGQGTLTVTNQGRLSSSAIPTLVGLNIGQGVFTVSNEGATLAQDIVATSFSSSVGTGSFAGGLNVAENFIVLPSGSVGIGGAVPGDQMLYVKTTKGPGIAMFSNNNDDASGAVISLQNDRAGSAGAANDFCGGITFYGQDTVPAVQQYAKISTKIGTPTSTSEDGYMLFEVTTAGTTATPYLRLDGATNAITASVDTYVLGALHQSGSNYRKYVNKSTNYTLTNADSIVYIGHDTNILTASLPDAETVDGIVYTIKNTSPSLVVIKPNGAQLIDGLGSITGSIGQSWTLASAGDVWNVLSSHSSSV